MIPTPKPGEIPESPERAGMPGRTPESVPLLFQSLEDIEDLKRTVKTLTEKVKSLEERVRALEAPKA